MRLAAQNAQLGTASVLIGIWSTFVQIGGYLRAGQRTRTPISASGCAASGSVAGRTGIRNPAVLARGVSTPVDTARHGKI
jgi:hypothetical protein